MALKAIPSTSETLWQNLVNWRFMALLCVVLLPFEMVFSAVRNQIGPIGYLFHPAFGAAIGCWILRREKGIPVGLHICLGIYGAGLVFSGLINGSAAFHVASVVLLGPVFLASVRRPVTSS
jgi:hypothetical protein